MATPETAQQQDNRLDTWHYPLGHACEQRLKNMAYMKLATAIRRQKRVQLSFCDTCIINF